MSVLSPNNWWNSCSLYLQSSRRLASTFVPPFILFWMWWKHWPSLRGLFQLNSFPPIAGVAFYTASPCYRWLSSGRQCRLRKMIPSLSVSKSYRTWRKLYQVPLVRSPYRDEVLEVYPEFRLTGLTHMLDIEHHVGFAFVANQKQTLSSFMILHVDYRLVTVTATALGYRHATLQMFWAIT